RPRAGSERAHPFRLCRSGAQGDAGRRAEWDSDTAGDGSRNPFPCCRVGLIASSAAVAAASAATATPAATSPAAATTLLGSGLVDSQGTAIDLLAVEARNGGLGLLIRAHLDEPEPLGTTGVPIHDDLRRLNRAELPEHGLEIAVGGVVR